MKGHIEEWFDNMPSIERRIEDRGKKVAFKIQENIEIIFPKK